jgi:transposase
LSEKNRVFTSEFKEGVARRILNGESVSALHQEIQIKRSVLYRWRDAYRKDGAAGLQRPVGRPPGVPNPPRPLASPEEVAAWRVAELERKIGQQALDIDFFRRAFKRVKESRRKNVEAGAIASTERSEA